MKNLSIRIKVAAGLLLFGVPLVATSYLNFLALDQTSSFFIEATYFDTSRIQTLIELRSVINGLTVPERGDEIGLAEKELDSSVNRINSLTAEYKRYLGNRTEIKLFLENTDVLAGRFTESALALYRLQTEKGASVDDISRQRNNFEFAGTLLRKEIDSNITREFAAIKKTSEMIRENTERTRAMNIGIILAGILIALFFWLFANKLISGPIMALRDAALDIARGNMERRVKIKFRDEVGELGAAFNLMADRLLESQVNLNKKIKEETKQLSAKVEEIELINKKLSDAQTAIVNVMQDLKAEKESVDKKIIERTAELSRESAKLNAIAQDIDVGLILLDHQGAPIFVNNKLRMLLKIHSLQNYETVFKEFIEKFSGYGIEEKLKDISSEKSADIPEAEVNGSIFDVKFRSLHTDEQESKFFGHLIIVEDITERKILEHSKSSFISIASHEMRTPLAIIRGNAELILDDPSVKRKKSLQEMVESIRSGAVRLLGIVSDFLDLTQLEEKRLQLKKERFDVAALINEVAAELKGRAAEKKLYIKNEIAEKDEPIFVIADRNKTKEIFINLIANGVQYTKKGGVTLSLNEKAYGSVRIFVSDTGAGIEKSQQKALFQKFNADNKSFIQSKEYGSGLGLYISRLIAESMGGNVQLEKSVVDEGSTFSVLLPLAEEK